MVHRVGVDTILVQANLNSIFRLSFQHLEKYPNLLNGIKAALLIKTGKGDQIMLGFICRLASSFEREHGIRPNLLYLNRMHSEQLKAAFDETYSFHQITTMLDMEIIVDPEIMHPHVAWSRVAYRAAS